MKIEPIAPKILVCLLLFELWPPSPVASEVSYRGTNTTLCGEVLEPVGGVIAGATVSLQNLRTKQILTTVTNADGRYGFSNVEPGEYELSVQKPLFTNKLLHTHVGAGEQLCFSTMLEWHVPREQKDCPAGPRLVHLPRKGAYDRLLIRLERHPCLGCQLDYSLEIRGDGTVSYASDWPDGRREASGSVSRVQLKRLVRQFRKAGYFSLCGEYSYGWTDLGETVTSIAVGGLRKEVKNYGGAGPQALRELESLIERTVNSHRWVHRDGDSLRDPITVEEDVHMASKPGFSPLMEASGRGDWKLVRRLISAGAKVNARDETGWTPLMVAAAAGCNHCVESLLKGGARVDARDDNGDTALIAAAPGEHQEGGYPNTETIRLLIEAGADVNVSNHFGETALMWAAWWVHPERVRVLMEAGSNVNARDKQGRTALSELKEGDSDRFLRTVAILRAKGAER